MVEINDKKNVFDTLPWLSIESVGKSASLAIVFQKNNRLQIITEQVESREGVKDSLLPLIEKTAESSVGSIQRISKFVLINGPGSFTGLRVVNSLIHGISVRVKQIRGISKPVRIICFRMVSLGQRGRIN